MPRSSLALRARESPDPLYTGYTELLGLLHGTYLLLRFRSDDTLPG
jgi:hypothetical protein